MATSDVDQQNLLSSDSYSPEEDEDEDASAMSLIEHLEELRRRLFYCIIAVTIGAIVAFFFRDQIISFLAAPLPTSASVLYNQKGGGTPLVVTGIGENLTVMLKLSLIAGFVGVLPFVLYQLWAFISPGLYLREKKYAIPFIVMGVVLFIVGAIVGYIVLRFPIAFLIGLGEGSFTQIITADSYFTFVAFTLLAFGVIFELPLILIFLSIIDIVDAQFLKEKRQMFHVGLWLAAVVLTPGADLYSPLILGSCVSALYEGSIFVIDRVIMPRKAREAALATTVDTDVEEY